MAFNPDRHHRRSIRLRGYDYSRAGAYFITLCTRDRACLFGDVIDDAMALNDAGQFVADEWVRSASLRSEIIIDTFIVMPNHLHGIVVIDHTTVGAYGNTPRHVDPSIVTGPVVTGAYVHTPLRSPSRTLGAMVRGFKAAVTTRINIARGTPGQPVWQRNYYEHIIRDADEHNRIRQYIQDNPRNWPNDEENPTYRAPHS